MSIRVIAGELGGRPLEAPPGHRTRPTRSAVREAWFNAIAADLPGRRVLDLFAGSGALGIEALSRGAASACFVEAEARALRVLRRNLDRLDLGERARVRKGDVFRFLANLPAAEYDIILADPPYRTEASRRLHDVWLARSLSGILCVEHGTGELADLEAAWRRAYGDTELSFFLAHQES